MTDIAAMLEQARKKDSADRRRRQNVIRALTDLAAELKGTARFYAETQTEGDGYAIQFVNRSNEGNVPAYANGVVLTITTSGKGLNQITVRGRTHVLGSAFLTDERDYLTAEEIETLRKAGQRALSDAKIFPTLGATRQPG